MDQNRTEVERKRAEINLVSARSDANLRALEEQVEGLRRTGMTGAKRA